MITIKKILNGIHILLVGIHVLFVKYTLNHFRNEQLCTLCMWTKFEFCFVLFLTQLIWFCIFGRMKGEKIESFVLLIRTDVRNAGEVICHIEPNRTNLDFDRYLVQLRFHCDFQHRCDFRLELQFVELELDLVGWLGYWSLGRHEIHLNRTVHNPYFQNSHHVIQCCNWYHVIPRYDNFGHLQLHFCVKMDWFSAWRKIYEYLSSLKLFCIPCRCCFSSVKIINIFIYIFLIKE